MKWQRDNPVLIQGISQAPAAYYGMRMKSNGTHIVAGVEAGEGGNHIGKIPVFDLVEQAIAETGEVGISLIFSPAYRVLDAALEAIAAGIRQIVIVTAGVPPRDMLKLLGKAQETNTFILGSGSQGLIVPNKLCLGTHEPEFFLPGKVGIISRSDCLTGEVARALTQVGIGQSMAISLGTDGIIGLNFEQWLQILEEDEQTQAIVLLGQPNGCAEISAAQYITSAIEKPVIVYIAGLQAPVERHLGDADSIIAARLSQSILTKSTEKQAIAAFKSAKVKIAKSPADIPALLAKIVN